MSKVSPIPEGFRTVSPYLIIKGAGEAIEFYKKAFGAQVITSMAGPGDSVMHAEIKIGDSMIMLSEEWPENHKLVSPTSVDNHSTVAISLYVEDADALFAQAVAAGATSLYPLENTFWGDRFGKVADPWGHQWQIATHIEDVSAEECERRAAAMFGCQ